MVVVLSTLKVQTDTCGCCVFNEAQTNFLVVLSTLKAQTETFWLLMNKRNVCRLVCFCFVAVFEMLIQVIIIMYHVNVLLRWTNRGTQTKRVVVDFFPLGG